MPIRPLICLLVYASVFATTRTHAADETFDRTVQPFLRKYCEECHGSQDAQANLRIDTSLTLSFQDPAVRGRWGEVVNVLNSHEMPPEDKTQPSSAEIAAVVDWVTDQLVQVEMANRENAVVMRRLNRDEYRNTIRDLVGVDIDVAHFPQDPAASGFDNVGSSLSLSPMQLELYLETAQKIMSSALVEGPKPETIRWRFEIDSGSSDSNRIKIDGQTPIVNGGNNPVRDGFKWVHHANWDKGLNVRDFAMKHPGKYIIRFRAASRVPDREEVVRSAQKILQTRFDKQMSDNPKGQKWHLEQMQRDLEHFQKDWIYRYGPARVKVILDLGGQPRIVDERDISSSLDSPGIFEVPVEMTTQRAGVTLEYAYSIPRVLENFWMQTSDEFARPELFVDWIEIEGPLCEPWPPASHQRLMPQEITDENEIKLSETIIGKFTRRAFRRPVSRAEVAPYVAIYQAARQRGESTVHALRSALSGVLVSPHFLFLVESETEPADTTQKKDRQITAHQLASRLSYFLWSSMPDDELMKQADTGKLLSPDILIAQALRMLKDPLRSESFVKNFSDQWLGLREVGSNPPATDLYPHYDRHLEVSMIEESRGLFRTILRDDRSVLDFIDSDYVFINERLARFYEIDGVQGDHHRVVPIAEKNHRGGVMTHASVLVITSNGTRTSPVKRGTWVLKNLLGTDPGLPVANAGDIAPKVPGIDKATVRQRLEIHRELPQCARCHNKIDPLGLSLENYNASGQFRLQEGFGYQGRIERDDPYINTQAKLPNGTLIDGPTDLKKALRKEENQFLQCIADKMLVYATGRETTIADRPAIQKAIQHVKANRYELDELVKSIVTSEPFLRH